MVEVVLVEDRGEKERERGIQVREERGGSLRERERERERDMNVKVRGKRWGGGGCDLTG